MGLGERGRRTFLPATVTIVSPAGLLNVHAALFGMLSCVAVLKSSAPDASLTVAAILLKPTHILPVMAVVVASFVSPMPVSTTDLLGAAASGAALRTASAAELRPKTYGTVRACDAAMSIAGILRCSGVGVQLVLRGVQEGSSITIVCRWGTRIKLDEHLGKLGIPVPGRKLPDPHNLWAGIFTKPTPWAGVRAPELGELGIAPSEGAIGTDGWGSCQFLTLDCRTVGLVCIAGCGSSWCPAGWEVRPSV